MKIELWLASRYLLSTSKKGFPSLLGIVAVIGMALGVAALVVVICVMSGFQSSLQNAICKVTGHIVVMDASGVIDNPDELISTLNRRDQRIKSLSPVIYGEGMLASEKSVQGIVIEGLMPDQIRERIPDIGDESLIGKHSIALGEQLAERLGVKIGDEVRFITPVGKPRSDPFTVKAIFKIGMHEFDAKYAFMSFNHARSFFNLGSSASAVKIYLHNPDNVDDVRKNLVDALPYSYSVRDWRTLYPNLFKVIAQEKFVIALLLILIIFVAAFNVASTLFMMVMEKQRTISVMRALGSSSRTVGKIFVIAGGIIGAAGTFLGIIAGLTIVTLLKYYPLIHLAPEIYYFDRLPVEIKVGEIALVALLAMIIAVVSTLYPSMRAGRLNPIEGIRYE